MAVPLHVISGYLGAGKTTLINRLLSSPGSERLCIIVNDFGELDIDAEILRRGDGITLSLANGCVCCSASAGLFKAFDTVLRLDPLPCRILLEASGVADPVRIAAVARAEPDLLPGGICTMVDSSSIRAGLADPLAAPEMEKQIRAANLVMLSCCDLATADEMSDALGIVGRMAPGIPVCRASSITSMADLLGLLDGDMVEGGMLPGEHRLDSHYTRMTFRGECLRHPDAFLRAIRDTGSPVLRLKGLVRVSGHAGFQSLNVVGHRVDLAPVRLETPPAQSLITAIVRADSGEAAEISRLVEKYLD